MSDINLLPENMREKERRELAKAANRPKVFSVELSAAPKSRPLPTVKPPKDKRSIWNRWFGKKGKSAVNIASPASLPSYQPGMRGADMLKAAKEQKQKIEYAIPKMPLIVKPKKSFWQSIGPAKSPIRPSAPTIRPILPAMAPVKSEPALIYRPIKTEIKFNKSPKGPGFFSRLLEKMASKPKIKKPELIISKSTEHKPIPIPVSPKPKPEKKARYHVAPKEKKMNFDVNLLPQDLIFRKYAKTKQQLTGVVLSAVLSLTVILGIYFIINQQQELIDRKIAGLTQDERQLLEKIKGFKNIQDKNIRFQDKTLAISKLLEKHVYWTKFFSLLEKYTLDSVQYTEFTADTSGKFVLPALAAMGSGANVAEQIADSYRNAARQIVALKQAGDFVKEVRVGNLEIVSSDKAGVKGVKFDLSIDLADGVFTDEKK